jgi:hypothetical protein
MRVRLTPLTNAAGSTRIFVVVRAEFNTTTGELTLTCRDGKICLGLVGSWELAIETCFVGPMSCDEAERVHDERSLIQVVN